MPVGIQLVGRRHGDARLLDIGAVGRAPLWEHGNERARTGCPPPRRSRSSAPATLTAEALTRACLDRAEPSADRSRPGPGSTRSRRWRRRARPTAPAGRACSPALPVGIKDIIDTVDMPTEHGSPIYRGNRPFADAACVALLPHGRRRDHGQDGDDRVRQPLSRARPSTRTTRRTRPGGSSSGSAAAVADFQVPLALGTQTGGSVIRPAAFCGVIGYKPSFGEFSRVGIKMQCHNLDTLGIICRTPRRHRRCCAARCSAQPPRADRPRRPRAPRIGFCRTPAWEHADGDDPGAARAHRRGAVGGRRAG